MNRQIFHQLVDLTYMEPDVVIDIVDDFSLQRCDMMHPQELGDAQFGIFPVPAPAKHRPPMLTEFQSILSAGIQSSTQLLEKTPFFHSAAQKSCTRMV
jgi:hypothetical protein